METNYIFSGIGHSAGKYTITNDYIADALRKGFLTGFDENRMAKSKNYLQYKTEHPNISPFDYFVREKMGFVARQHVTPFPPTRKKLNYAETSVELGVKAVQNAILDANISPKDIDAWFVSTVSPKQKAPGIASIIKSHFVDVNNYSPAFTITSGCSGFNLNLQSALEYLNNHPEAKHIVVGHTETMSTFLTQRVKVIPFVTFGDGAAFVILSRTQAEQKEGVIAINNFQDLQMVDYVGVDIKSNLYMTDSVIKDRATHNIPKASVDVLKQSGWQTSDIDLCVPHQTGSAILFEAADRLELDRKKMYLDAQYKYGNVSGATVPIALSMLNEANTLKAGDKLLCPVAGVGGNYGAFTYIVPKNKPKCNTDKLFANDLKNRTTLVLGGSGALGSQIAYELIRRGSNVILQYNKNTEVINKIAEYAKQQSVNIYSYQSDFNDLNSVNHFAEEINKQHTQIDYFVNAVGVLLSRQPNKVMNINYLSPLHLFKQIFNNITGTALFVGAASEDVNVTEIESFISAKRSLHGVMGSMSGELFKKNNHLIWYMPGVLENGMLRNIDPKALYKFMLEIGQQKPLSVEDTAFRIASSLYIPKIEGTNQEYENTMVVVRDGYKLQVDI